MKDSERQSRDAGWWSRPCDGAFFGKSELSLSVITSLAAAVAVFGRDFDVVGQAWHTKSCWLQSASYDIGVYPFVVPFVDFGTIESSVAVPPSMVAVYQGVAEMLSAGDLRSEQMSAGCAKCGACSALSLFEQLSQRRSFVLILVAGYRSGTSSAPRVPPSVWVASA